MNLIEIAQDLNGDLSTLSFELPTAHVYNPAEYAWDNYRKFIEKYGYNSQKKYVLIGMNPGPWGMAQTGIPFGDPVCARDFFGITGPVNIPAHQHAKRPIYGFDSPRREVSGQRVWQFAAAHFGQAEAFFEDFFIINYCPLIFLETSGRNRTPDKLSSGERKALYAACDRALIRNLQALKPEHAIGIGRFARNCLDRIQDQVGDVKIGHILHPSPASPAANRGWKAAATKQLQALGIALPGGD